MQTPEELSEIAGVILRGPSSFQANQPLEGSTIKL